MARGPKKHLKRINTPASWYLNKLTGLYAPRPMPGTHKIRQCIPMMLLIRDQLKFALTASECKTILGQKAVTVDGKVRTERRFPLGSMDVVKVANQNYRMMLDIKGRMRAHKIDDSEAKFKLLRVREVRAGQKGIPSACCHDGRNVPFVAPEVKANDTLIFDIESKTVKGFEKFKLGAAALVDAGHSRGRVGEIVHIKKHPGASTVITLKDAANQVFVTPQENCIVIGPSLEELMITLPKGDGIKKGISEDRLERIAHHEEVRERQAF
eukprot:GHVH01003910.1.p1 GENE.GHVH01003910.1~~GHVH01003910.1.p1  ORF type:complete len:268 (+),score=51.25 GHVH01003910.1:69-872(+)